MNYSWNQPMCFDCYQRRYPGRRPVSIKEEAYTEFSEYVRVCVDCGRLTVDRIWMRVDPAQAMYPTEEKED